MTWHPVATNVIQRKNKMSSALICLDLINDLIHPDGKLANKGYVEFAKENDTIQRIARIQDHFRQNGQLIVHTRVGFSEGYVECPPTSPLFGHAKKQGALQLGTWGTDLLEEVGKKGAEPALTKHRVSPFYRTRLELILRTQNVNHLYICGVSTNLAVEQTAREAHDRDLAVTVISDACIAADMETHSRALESIKAFADVKPFGDVAVQLATNPAN